MTKRSPNFARVLAGGEPLSAQEIDAVIAIGHAMANADGHTSLDELESFRALVKHFKPSVNLRAVLDELGAELDAAESMEDRIRAEATKLTRPAAREAAFKAAYTIAIFDLETNEEERDLEELLIEVLQVGSTVDELESQVNEALMG